MYFLSKTTVSPSFTAFLLMRGTGVVVLVSLLTPFLTPPAHKALLPIIIYSNCPPHCVWLRPVTPMLVLTKIAKISWDMPLMPLPRKFGLSVGLRLVCLWTVPEPNRNVSITVSKYLGLLSRQQFGHAAFGHFCPYLTVLLRRQTGNMRKETGYDMHQRSPVGLKAETLWLCGMCCNHLANRLHETLILISVSACVVSHGKQLPD